MVFLSFQIYHQSLMAPLNRPLHDTMTHAGDDLKAHFQTQQQEYGTALISLL